ncbi:MAG: phosphotransferase family protein [Candidatus Thorarchaeota archaeon]
MEINRLLKYLRFRYDQDDLLISNLKNITSGWETEILSFDLEDSEGHVQKLVARIYPGLDAVHKAKKESSIMMKLQEIGYPVPTVHLVETEKSHLGNPFMIMDRIDGGTLDDKMYEDQDRWASVFFDLFVDLHQLDWKKMIPPDMFPLFDDSYFYIKTTLSDMERTLNINGKQELLPIVDWAKHRYKDVPCKTPSIIHGDFHTFNVLVDETEKAYVIDWGASKVADFRSDLAWTLLLSYAYDTRERRDLVLHGYETALGREVEQIEYFEVLSTVRRLYDVTSSFDGKSNLRPEAIDMMRETAGHIVRVRNRLNELTGITIPMIDKFVDTLS